jgi:hypothetical protein
VRDDESYANLYEENDGEGEPRTLKAQLARRGMVPFELVTSLGVILVDGTEADLEIAPTPVYPRLPEREALFLREHDRDERVIDTSTFEDHRRSRHADLRARDGDCRITDEDPPRRGWRATARDRYAAQARGR